MMEPLLRLTEIIEISFGVAMLWLALKLFLIVLKTSDPIRLKLRTAAVVLISIIAFENILDGLLVEGENLWAIGIDLGFSTVAAFIAWTTVVVLERGR